MVIVQLAFGLSPATWIGDSLSIIGGLTLKNLTLPGTHDSGTYFLTDTPMPGDKSEFWTVLYELADLLDKDVGLVAKDWAQSQDQDFYQQMQGGIRYFDLRAGWQSLTQTWVTFHFVEGYPVQYLLGNISQYLKDYPSEIVVVEMSHFDGFPTENAIESLKQMVLNTLGPFLQPVDLNFSFTVNQMITTGKRALVTMASGFDNTIIWPPSTFYGSYADSPDIKKMIDYNNKTVELFMSQDWPGQLFQISWTLTPDTNTVLDTVIPWKPHTLIQLADYGNIALPSFYTEMKKYGWRMGNILLIDHYEKSNILQVVWGFNGIPY